MNARWGVVSILAVAGATWAAAAGCATGEVVIQPTTDCVGYGPNGYWHKEEPPVVTVCTDGEVAGLLQFKGPGGRLVSGGGILAAPGCVSFPMPPGAVTYDWIKAEPAVPPIQPLVFAPFLPAGLTETAFPKDSQDYTFGCAPLKAWSSETARLYEVSVLAKSLAEAQSLVNPVLYHGPGTPVPPGLTVHYYVEARLEGSALEIRSSLRDAFDSFQVDIDGQPVAELDSGLQVQVTKPGARWTTVTATIPLSQLSQTMDLSLRQQGRHDPNELNVQLDF